MVSHNLSDQVTYFHGFFKYGTIFKLHPCKADMLDVQLRQSKYSGILHLRKWGTAFLKKVSSYKKVFSLEKYHFLIMSKLMNHYIIMSLGQAFPRLSMEWVLGDGQQGNFQKEKGTIWPLLNWF